MFPTDAVKNAHFAVKVTGLHKEVTGFECELTGLMNEVTEFEPEVTGKTLKVTDISKKVTGLFSDERPKRR